MTIVDCQTLRTCPRTGAETVLWRLTLKRSLDRRSVSDVAALYGEGLRRLRNARSGAVAFAETWSSIYDDDGAVIPRLRLIRPRGREIMTCTDFLETAWEDWSDDQSFEADWAAAVAALPSHDCEEIAMVGGLLLPIWNRLPNDAPRVRRVTTDCGQTLLGRVVPLDDALHDAGVETLGAVLQTLRPVGAPSGG